MFVKILWWVLISTVGLFIMGTKGQDDCVPCYNYPTRNSSSNPCYHASKRCDGVVDCENGKDELDCVWCSNNGFKCLFVLRCISSLRVCDGIRNCPDGSDESAEHAHCDASNKSGSGDGSGVNIGAFIGASLAILAIFLVVLTMIILYIYRHKPDCLNGCHWCTRRGDQEDEETLAELPRCMDNPPEYSACVNEGFVPDSQNDSQSTSRTLPPSYEDVLKEEFLITLPGKLESYRRYPSTIDTERSYRERPLSNAQIQRSISEVTVNDEEVPNHASIPQSLLSFPADVSDTRGRIRRQMAAKTFRDFHNRPGPINTISGQLSENSLGVTRTNNY